MLKTLIEDFIDFTRFENNSGISINKINVNIRSLVSEVEELYNIQIKEKCIDFVVCYTSNVPETFKTDPIRLKQILMNLVSNAIKFTSKGRITIDVCVEPFSLYEGKEVEDMFSDSVHADFFSQSSPHDRLLFKSENLRKASINLMLAEKHH